MHELRQEDPWTGAKMQRRVHRGLSLQVIIEECRNRLLTVHTPDGLCK